MKLLRMKLLGIVMIGLMFTLNVQAEKAYGTAGCGLGLLIFGKKDNQVLAATTNGSSGTQTFGITSGTSGCTDAGVIKKGKEVSAFIESNQRSLANDIAKGKGESISSLAALMRCSDTAQFGSVLKSHYNQIFENSNVNAEQVEKNIRSLLKSEKSVLNCNVG